MNGNISTIARTVHGFECGVCALRIESAQQLYARFCVCMWHMEMKHDVPHTTNCGANKIDENILQLILNTFVYDYIIGRIEKFFISLSQ